MLSSLSSSFKGLVGLLYIGAQVTLSMVLAGVSGSVKHRDGLGSATRTTETILAPTKCVLSNGTLSSPYVAAMGYATVIFFGLFFILQAKGFSYTSTCTPGPPPPPTPPPSPEYPVPSASKISPATTHPTLYHNGMDSEPPAPPPDPGSDSADEPPRRKPWWLLLPFIAFALGSYVYFTRNPDSRVVPIAKTLSAQIISPVEKCILQGWTAAVSGISTAKTYAAQHGQTFCKILLLGVATHCLCLVVFTILVRLRRYFTPNNPNSYVECCKLSLIILAFVCLPRLNWVFWMDYYMAWMRGSRPAVRNLDANLVRFLASLSIIPPPHVSTIVGIIGVHICAISLRAAFLLVSGLPFATRTILRELSRPWVFCRFICSFLGQTILTGLVCNASAAWAQRRLLLRGYILDWLRSPILDWLHSMPSAYQPPGHAPWSDSELFLCHYRHWKSTQIKDLHALAPRFKSTLLATFKALLGIWYQLPLAQKLLIAAPAVIFYGYRYFMPKARLMSRRVQALIRIWRR